MRKTGVCGEVSFYNNLRIMTNLSCDQRCRFCYQQNYATRYVNFSTILTELEKYMVPSSKLYEVFESVTILGGEPTLHPKIDQIVDWFKNDQQMPIVRMNTNGKRLLRGDTALDVCRNLDVLCFDVGLGQTEASVNSEDFKTTAEKVELARGLLDTYEHLSVKFNHVFYEENKKVLGYYFKWFLALLKKSHLDMSRVMVNVCEDVNSDTDINVDRFLGCVGEGRIDSQESKFFTKLYIQGVDVAYFGFDKYGATKDFVLIWEKGSTTNILDYLKVVECKGVVSEV